MLCSVVSNPAVVISRIVVNQHVTRGFQGRIVIAFHKAVTQVLARRNLNHRQRIRMVGVEPVFNKLKIIQISLDEQR